MEFLLIFVSAVLVNNFVLVQFLGLCPFVGVSKNIENSLGLSFAVIFVLTITSMISYLLQKFVLQPFDLMFLKTIAFIVTIASIVQLLEILIKKSSPVLYGALGIFLPLITVNCIILGVIVINSQNMQGSLLKATFFGFSAALGFTFALVIFSFLQERIKVTNTPKAFSGLPINLITAGILSMAFMGFSGIA